MTESKKQQVQDELKDSIHKVWLAGLGAVAMAEQEGGKFLKNLVDKGEEYESQSKERFEDVRGKVNEATDQAKDRAESTIHKVGDKFDEAVSNALRRLGVPNREEISTLTRRVEELTTVVEQLRDTKTPSKKTAAKKPAEVTER